MSLARIEEMLTESDLRTDDFADLVGTLAPLDDLADHAPTPSAELAALFAPTVQAPIPLSERRKRAVAGALVLALSGVGATGLSAAANTLPRPIQHQVSKFAQHYLPFDLPEPPPPGQPFGADVPVSPELPRPGDVEASRSAQQRAGLPADAVAGSDAAGRPDSAHAYAAGPSAALGPSASAQPSASAAPFAPSSAAPSPSASPAWGGPTPGHGDPEGRPAQGSTKGPRGDDGKKPGPGPKSPTGGQGSGNVPTPSDGEAPGPTGGGDSAPAPTLPDPLPTIPIPVPLPDPLPDLGPVLQTPEATPQTTGD